jgi:hypothetical protein
MRPFARAVALLAIVVAGCLAVQGALPVPSQGSLIAAQALKQFVPRNTTRVQRKGGGLLALTAHCASYHLIRAPHSASRTGPVIRTWIEGRRSPSVPVFKPIFPRVKFKFAACPLALRDWVGAELERGSPVGIANVRYRGLPTFRLTFLTRPNLVVYFDRRTLRLIAVNVHIERSLDFAP